MTDDELKRLFDAIREVKGTGLTPRDVRLINAALAGEEPVQEIDRAAFFAKVRSAFGPLRQAQVDGFNTLLDAMKAWPVAYTAYGLATAWHETAHTMQPIAEYGKGTGRPYGKPGRNGGQIPYGRGYVQLTWDENYERADRELGLNGALIADYDKAMEPDIAAAIMVRGMQEGWFTGKKLSNYLPGDYINARRVINGTDRSALIAGYARVFEKALTA